MNKLLRQSLVMLLLMTFFTGILYPLAVTGVAQLIFPHQANGSLILRDGRRVGSSLIGQSFT
ncbi:MAG: potassium-transporting ATPase subunit C, partial [Rhodanobacter sp.]